MEIQRGDFEQTTSHWWWRPGWSPETRYFTFHLTFAEEPALTSVAERYSGTLTSLAHVDPIPTPWLHLTMTGVGHTCDVSDEIVDALCDRVIGDAANIADHQSPIIFDTLYLGKDGLSLTGQAPEWLTQLRRRQEEAVEELVGGPHNWSRIRPHVSLAYFDGQIDEAALLHGMRESGLDDIVITRPTVSLLELRRDGHLYRWCTVADRVLDLSA
ncbi:MAG: hypothetical protein R2722_13990 [Tessaracoccus sp.]